MVVRCSYAVLFLIVFRFVRLSFTTQNSYACKAATVTYITNEGILMRLINEDDIDTKED